MASASTESGFHAELDKDGLIARRRTEILPDGAYLFQDKLNTTGVMKATIITCRAWLVEFYELESGEVYLIHGDREVRPRTTRFAIFYSSFSITQPCFSNTLGDVLGIASLEQLPPNISSTPKLFEITSRRLPTNVAEVVEMLQAPDGHQSIESNPSPSLLSLKAKRLIDENYLAYPSLARIAERLSVTHEHLSRQFKRDFGMSPRNYLRQLRVADAPLKLAKGEEIIEVSQDVGYNDLSRFYKQFRKTTETSPGACKTILRPKPNRG
jgi:AraC-like DNA-binding protein